MNKEKLYHLCGISAQIASKSKQPKWVSAQLRFLGAEHYVLGTKSVELVVKHKGRGISLMFKQPLVFEASALLGKAKVEGLLMDVEVVIGDVTMHLACMHSGMYPIVLRNHETVALI